MINLADDLVRNEQRTKIKNITKMVSALNWDSYPNEKAQFTELADQIKINGTEADPAAITIDGEHFAGLANVYLTMTYTDPDGNRDLVTSDTVGMTYAGEIDENGPRLTSVRPEIEAFLK